jgi:putative ABC transport system permease protein
MEGLWQDIRYSLRQLLRSPGFTLVAILTLAVGIGANTAIFSVVYSVILRPLPYPQADRIMEVARKFPSGSGEYTTFHKFRFWREHNQVFQHLAATTGAGFNLAGGASPERIHGLRVSSDYLSVLGVFPMIGRDFVPEEDSGDGQRVAILSNGLWKRHFGADRNLIGQSISLDGELYTVIGGMPPGFQTEPPSDIWVPLALEPKGMLGGTNFTTLGRLKPGITPEIADADMAVVAEQYRKTFPERMRKGESIQVFGYRAFLSRSVRSTLLIFFGAVTLVLLIACVNVANLLLTRAAARGREIAIRTALGAGRPRLIRQLLTESVILALASAVVGVFLANVGLDSLLTLVPVDLPRAQDIAVDRWALSFTILIAAMTGILFGLAPAFQASRFDPNEALKENAGRAATSGTRRGRLRSILVVSEVALSLMLLAGATLMIRTLSNLLGTNAGFEPGKILTVEMWLMGSNYNSTAAMNSFYQASLSRIQSLPGVEAAGIVVAGLPLQRGGNTFMVRQGHDANTEGFSADYREITPDYFRAMGTPVRMGRPFNAADTARSQRAAIINESFARQAFGKTVPLGQSINMEPGSKKEDLCEIVGVVGDVKSSLDRPAAPTLFVPATQADFNVTRLFNGIFPAHLIVMASGKPLGLAQAVQQELHAADPALALGKTRSMEQVRSASVTDQEFNMLVLSIFAGLALILAAVGIYGVMAYSVSQRTHEIGIRLALGAQRGDVFRLIIGQGVFVTLIGIAVGLAGGLAATSVLSSMLFGVKPTDPWTFAGVSIGLLGVALLACYLPARRAMRVDPMVALRYE